VKRISSLNSVLLRSGSIAVSALILSSCAFFQMPAKESSQPEVQAVKPVPPKKTEDDELEVSSISIIEAAPVSELKAEPIAASVSKPTRELPKEPNTFLIDIEEKNKSHPFFGIGHEKGFALNGVQGKWLVLERGKQYTFRVRTNVKHDFYLSKSPKGWGSSVYTRNVDGQFTYNGDVTFQPQKDTPDELYYQCRNHQSMGGKLLIVDAGSDLEALQAKLDTEQSQYSKSNPEQSAKSTLSPSVVKQKVSYASMLIMFKGKALDADEKSNLENKVKQAQASLDKNELDQAMALAEDVVSAFNKKPKAGPSKEELEEMRGEYEGVLASVQSFEESHDAAKRSAQKEKREIVDYDAKEVARLLAEADNLAKSNSFKQAINKARLAERAIAEAMNAMLGSRTLVYELKFDTPKDEYEYEVNRYRSYMELIPVAIEVKKPAKASVDLMQRYVDKGQFFHDKSQESASVGNYTEALVIIKDATMEVRRGLMLLGVSM